MSRPAIAGREPIAYEVKEGRSYYWCTCGLSKRQPLCDGSHMATQFEPLAWKASEDATVYFCACKQTASAPLCDGAHTKL
jgi:CDGSH-type Zn-finger protein